jgi:hypothetical protein
MASSGGTLTYTPSVLVKYIGLTAALVVLGVLTYLINIFPNSAFLVGIAAYIPSASLFVAHDLEGSKTPNGIPNWTTFLVVTIVSGLEGAVGAFVLHNGSISLSAGLVWGIAVLTLIFHTVAEDQGANAPLTVEAWITAGIGIAVGFLGFFYSNPNAGIAAWISTAFVLIPEYLHITTDGSSISVTPVPNPPAPTPPTPPSSA